MQTEVITIVQEETSLKISWIAGKFCVTYTLDEAPEDFKDFKLAFAGEYKFVPDWKAVAPAKRQKQWTELLASARIAINHKLGISGSITSRVLVEKQDE